MESVLLKILESAQVKGEDRDKLLALTLTELTHATKAGGENLLDELPLGFGEAVRLIRRAGEMPLYLAKIVALWYQGRGISADSIKAAVHSECGLEYEREFSQLVWEARSALPCLGLDHKSLTKANLMQEAYRTGYKYEQDFGGCAQCTVATISKLASKENPDVFRAAGGFSGGMAQMGDSACGGYSGGLMAMGLFAGRRLEFIDSDLEERTRIMGMARRLYEKFAQTYVSCICHGIQKEIFGRVFHLSRPEEKEAFELAGAHTLDKCTAVVGAACAWAAEILFDEGFLTWQAITETEGTH